MGWDGMGWDGMGWDGMGWDGMGWDGMGWDGSREAVPVQSHLHPQLADEMLTFRRTCDALHLHVFLAAIPPAQPPQMPSPCN